jgi:hypothetical protein
MPAPVGMYCLEIGLFQIDALGAAESAPANAVSPYIVTVTHS